MKRTLITFLSFILATPAFAMISGTVFLNDKEPAQHANIALADTEGNPIPGKGTSVDADGHFEISDDAPNIIISYMGYKEKSISTSEDLTNIVLEEDQTWIEQVDTTDKKIKQGEPCSYTDGDEANDTVGKYAKTSVGSFSCKPNCRFATYTPVERHKYSSENKIDVYYWTCELDPAKDRKNKDECTLAELKSLNLEHVKSAIVEEWDEKTGVATKCKIHECENSDYTLKDNQCVSKNGEPCTPSNNANVTSATWQNNGGKSLTCLINSCSNNLVPNEDKTACVDSKAVKQAEKNLKAAKQNENSFANKALTGATMATTGIGGMMIGSGLSEQFADDDAYADMRAYIDTFRCEYGSGQIAYGGDTNVDLPGGNELTDLYVQYTTLANDLKIRKQALNIRPGIESEVIIDKADSGLYDNAGAGIISGGYASVARAILNPGDSDSEKLKTQRNDSADKLEVGTGLAGGGIAGSMLINKSQK